jgi:hypothetical protein
MSHRQLNRWTDPSVPQFAQLASTAACAATASFIMLDALVNFALPQALPMAAQGSDGTGFWMHNF